MTTAWDDNRTRWDGGITIWDGRPEGIGAAIPCFYPCEAAPECGDADISLGGCYTLRGRIWIKEYEDYPCQGIVCRPEAAEGCTVPCFQPCAAPCC